MVDEAGLYGNAGNQYENPEGEKELSLPARQGRGRKRFHLVAVRLHGLLVLEKIVHARYFLMRKETCMAEKLNLSIFCNESSMHIIDQKQSAYKTVLSVNYSF